MTNATAPSSFQIPRAQQFDEGAHLGHTQLSHTPPKASSKTTRVVVTQ
jgi:hypothetical protein